MRVLYVHQYFTTPAGSIGTRAYEFCRHLVDQGHEVTVVTGVAAPGDLRPTGWVERRTIDGIEVVLLDIGMANHMAYPSRIARFLAFMAAATAAGVLTRRPDVVFASSTPLTVGIPGMIASWWHRTPFVFEVRDLWPKYAVAYGALKNPLLIRAAELLERACYARADRIVTISEPIARDIEAAGVPAAKLVCIPIGADLGPTAPAEPPAPGDRPFRVVYTGTHGKVNALELVLDAAAVLRARGAAVEFHLVGQGRDKAALMARAAAEGLANVHFHDPVPKARMADVLAAADLCVISALPIPEARAIFPNKFFDYVAAGRPVVVNFPSEMADLIAAEGLGAAVPPGDATALADAIAALAADPGACRRMGERARAVAADRFDRRALARRLEGVFAGVIAADAA